MEKNKENRIMTKSLLFYKSVTTNKKSIYNKLVNAFFSMWSQLGSNQRPSDYESDALTN